MERGLELASLTRVVDGEPYLSDVSMALAPGSFTALLGRTRAGKTSLLRLLAGLDRPSAGRVCWNGEDVSMRAVRERDVAMVYQQFVNYPSLSVYENIASPLRAKRGVPREEIDRRVREAAELLRIERLLDRLPAELSGGQQQRTAIARALVKRAGLLLLDEPLANLDYKLREELRSELRALFRTTDAVVVYATAEPSEALLLGGSTAVLHEGRLLQQGPALSVYHAPVDQEVARICSDPELSLLPVQLTPARVFRLDAERAIALPPTLATLPAGAYRLGLRAHHVRLSASGEGDARLSATVISVEVGGSETLIHARAGAHQLSALVQGVHRLELGAALELFVSPARLFVFDATGKLLAAPTRGAAGAQSGAGDGVH
jgi:glycerol transport system ATP-binding protein